METFDDNINGILARISEIRDSLTYEKHGIYSDGNTCLIQIAFFDAHPRQRKIGAIVYEADNGNVMHYFYRGLSRKGSKMGVVDLLLEILSLESTHASG